MEEDERLRWLTGSVRMSQEVASRVLDLLRSTWAGAAEAAEPWGEVGEPPADPGIVSGADRKPQASGEAAVPVVLPERYEDRGLLGMGGMGEVRRVHDRLLERDVAMKLVRRELGFDPEQVRRFVAEARATAALAHPGIVPVHDHGLTPDGRVFFTMQEVRGASMRDWMAGPDGASLRRRVDVLGRAAEAVAHAHDRGMLHRDLKPDNVVVGERGEVMVVDWGLFYGLGGDTALAGTPRYMPPEQARGEVEAWGPPLDVWALGMVLRELLVGEPAWPELGGLEVLRRLREGEVPAPPEGPGLPEELVALCAAALSPRPAVRPADAGAFARALRAWLDGEGRRERARAHVAAALEHELAAAALAEGAADARRRAAERYAASRPWEPAETRRAAWEAEDEALALERRAGEADRAAEDELSRALVHDPDCADAHAAMVRRLRERRARLGEGEAALAVEAGLRRHADALPAAHPDRVAALRWLRGDGAVTLHTDPPGLPVELHRYVERDRRLVPVFERALGRTPLDAVPLPRGSWLLRVRGEAEGRADVDYPVFLDREEHWHGVPPGGHAGEGEGPAAVFVPPHLDPDDRYVPAGWARLGGDPEAPAGLDERRVWVDGFVMRRFPVTNEEYLAFVNDLVDRGQGALAERYVPRDRGRSATSWGAILFGRDEGGHFFLTTDADGDRWEPRHPVVMVDHVAAWAYARWWGERTGLDWRLPAELEWEKAARGVDGRVYPWGSFADPTWAALRVAYAGSPPVEAVDARPLDESPYGVRGMAGGVLDWTADRSAPGGPPTPGGRVLRPDGHAEDEAAWLDRTASWRIVARGGSRLHELKSARAAFRLVCDPWSRSSNLGIRLVRSV